MTFDMTNCPKIPLPKLLSFIVDNRGKTVPTADEGHVLIATNCINNESLYPVFEKVRHLSDDTYKTWFRAHPQPGDIIFVNKGTPGRVCMVPDPVNFCIAQDMIAFRVDSNKVYNKFLFAVLRGREIQTHIYNTNVGDVIPHFKKSFLDQLLIPLPSMEIQHKIGDIYFNLSEKVNCNTKINLHLELIAQAIFKSWFVDFEPWGGVMPSNWQKGIISDLCSSIFNGGTPRRNEPRFWSDEIPWLTSGEVRQAVVTKTENFISEAGLMGSSAKWVSPLATIVALYGATAGQVSLVASSLTTNQAICALIPIENFAFYNYLSMRNAVGELENRAVGSAQQNISKAIVEQTSCLIPCKEIAMDFNNIVKPLFEAWIANLRESINLAAARDALLPRLMSGELTTSTTYHN